MAAPPHMYEREKAKQEMLYHANGIKSLALRFKAWSGDMSCWLLHTLTDKSILGLFLANSHACIITSFTAIGGQEAVGLRSQPSATMAFRGRFRASQLIIKKLLPPCFKL